MFLRWCTRYCKVFPSHHSKTVQQTLKQTLSCEHLSQSLPGQPQGSLRRDLPLFLRLGTWWTAFPTPGPSACSISTPLRTESCCSWSSKWSVPASSVWTWRTGDLENCLKLQISFHCVFLLFCLFWGQKAGAGRVITWWKAKKHIFMCDYLH